MDFNFSGKENASEFSKAIRYLLIYAWTIGEIDKDDYSIHKFKLRILFKRLLSKRNTEDIFKKLKSENIGHALNHFNFLIHSKREEGVYRFSKIALSVLFDDLTEDEQKFLTTLHTNDKHLNGYLEYRPILPDIYSHHFMQNSNNISKKLLEVNFHFDSEPLQTRLTVRALRGEVSILSIWILEGFKPEKCIRIFDRCLLLDSETTLTIPFARSFLTGESLKYGFCFVISDPYLNSYKVNSDNSVQEFYELSIENDIETVLECQRKYLKQKVECRKRFLNPFESDRALLQFMDDNFEVNQNLPHFYSERYSKLMNFIRNDCIFDEQNYLDITKILLELEDLYITNELENFCLYERDVTILENNQFEVDISNDDIPKALSEGDQIQLQILTGSYKNQILEGVIIDLDKDKIMFEFSNKKESNIKFTTDSFQANIKFRKDKSTFAMELEMLGMIDPDTLNEVLFLKPSLKNMRVGSDVEQNQMVAISNYVTFEWTSDKIKSNWEQQAAIKSIVNCTPYPAPFILFGPPGTGKTTTLVESIIQIWKLKPSARILVTAYSNFAVDEIAKRLLNFIPNFDCLRLYAQSMFHKVNQIDQKLIEISNIPDKVTSIAEILTYRIVLSTLKNAGNIVLKGLSKNKFDYIFIDECASSIEASAVIPIAGFMSVNDTNQVQIVLAGDPKQLGPIVCSPFIESLGLGKSLMERYMTMGLYDSNSPKFSSKAFVKLTKNFRTNAAILRVPNELFYDGKLQSQASPNVANFACGWGKLPNRNIPIIFHISKDASQIDESSKSLFNRRQIEIVLQYIELILKHGINGQTINQNEIGVLTPYRKQFQEIRTRLHQRGWKSVESGSTEQFQGQERKVMIISTVRSKTKTIGFLNNPRRMNVALTRAQGLLIVIGNPDTLCKDTNWGYFINYCENNNAVTNKIIRDDSLPRLPQGGATIKKIQINDNPVKKSLITSTNNKSAEDSNQSSFRFLVNSIVISFIVCLSIKFITWYSNK